MRLCLVLCCIFVLSCAPAQAAATRTIAAAALVLGGTMTMLASQAHPEQDIVRNAVPAILGSTAVVAGAVLHHCLFPAYATDWAKFPCAAVTCVLGHGAYFTMRGLAEPGYWTAPVVATYITSGSGMVRYATNRAWGSVRELVVDAEHPPGFYRIFPVWMANQLTGNLLDLGSHAMMHGVAFSVVSLMPDQQRVMADYYQGYDSLLEFALAKYSVTAAGSFASAVCATFMTYQFPILASTWVGRMPCHLTRLGVRMGMRAALAYHESSPGEDWQKKFWDDEKWRAPADFLIAINRHRWWESAADTYMRDLGALAFYEYEPPHLTIHGSPAIELVAP
jgi:hypothetical protein